MKEELKNNLEEYVKEYGKRDNVYDNLLELKKQPRGVGICILLIEELKL